MNITAIFRDRPFAVIGSQNHLVSGTDQKRSILRPDCTCDAGFTLSLYSDPIA